MREPTSASIARRFLEAVAAAARGIAQALDDAMPTPQPIPVRVKRSPRS